MRGVGTGTPVIGDDDSRQQYPWNVATGLRPLSTGPRGSFPSTPIVPRLPPWTGTVESTHDCVRVPLPRNFPAGPTHTRPHVPQSRTDGGQ